MRNRGYSSPLDPNESIIYGSQIDRDLNITDRGRRKMIARGAIPPPDGYLGSRSFWTLANYAAFKKKLLDHGSVSEEEKEWLKS